MLESRDTRQVPDKRRVEVQSQNRDLLIRDVCTCLARGALGRFTNTGHRNEVLILAEIRSTTFSVLWPRSGRDLRVLLVGDRVWASRIQVCFAGSRTRRVCFCTLRFGTSIRRREHEDCRLPAYEGHTLLTPSFACLAVFLQSI